MRLEFAKIKGAKIIAHAKSPTFRAAKLKGFTVSSFHEHSPCEAGVVSYAIILSLKREILEK